MGWKTDAKKTQKALENQEDADLLAELVKHAGPSFHSNLDGRLKGAANRVKAKRNQRK